MCYTDVVFVGSIFTRLSLDTYSNSLHVLLSLDDVSLLLRKNLEARSHLAEPVDHNRFCLYVGAELAQASMPVLVKNFSETPMTMA